jgi:hypothetical protein
MQTLHERGDFQELALKPSVRAAVEVLRRHGPLAAGDHDRALAHRYVASTVRAARRELLELGLIDRLGQQFVARSVSPTAEKSPPKAASGSRPDRVTQCDHLFSIYTSIIPRREEGGVETQETKRKNEETDLEVYAKARARALRDGDQELVQVLEAKMRKLLGEPGAKTSTPTPSAEKHACSTPRVSPEKEPLVPAEKLEKALREQIREFDAVAKRQGRDFAGAPLRAKWRRELALDPVSVDALIARAEGTLAPEKKLEARGLTAEERRKKVEFLSCLGYKQ